MKKHRMFLALAVSSAMLFTSLAISANATRPAADAGAEAGSGAAGCVTADLPTATGGLPGVDTHSAQQIADNPTPEGSPAVDGAGLAAHLSMTAWADVSGNVELTISNQSSVEVEMGEAFSLQVSQGEGWAEVPMSLAYTDLMMVLAPGESRTFCYQIGSAVTLQPELTYQITKTAAAGQTEVTLTAPLELR